MKCIEDEIPFEIPENWRWVRLGLVCPYGDCEKVKPSTIDDDEWVLDLEDIEKDTGRILAFYNKSERKSLSDKHRFLKGQLLYSKLRPYLNKVLIAPRDGYCTPEILPLHFWCEIQPKYMKLFLKSKTFLSYVNLLSYGVKMPRLGTDDGKNTLVPIPPISEQKKIANRYDDIIPLIDILDTHQKELEFSVLSLKSKILDLAIRGKLVPQDPNDEPASVLLERIRAEKEELIKQGKIKRDKKESVIFKGDDNSYYEDLPLHWSITTLRNITTPLSLNDGDWIVSDNMSANGEIKLLQLGSIGNMEYIDKGFKHITKQTFDELSCTPIMPGYLLVNRIVSDSMHCCIIPDLKGTTITTVDTCWIAPSPNMYNIKFLMYQLASPSFQKLVSMNASGTTRKRISKNNLINLQLLFPPLAEQNRIVEAIENSFEYLENIVSSAL